MVLNFWTGNECGDSPPHPTAGIQGDCGRSMLMTRAPSLVPLLVPALLPPRVWPPPRATAAQEAPIKFLNPLDVDGFAEPGGWRGHDGCEEAPMLFFFPGMDGSLSTPFMQYCELGTCFELATFLSAVFVRSRSRIVLVAQRAFECGKRRRFTRQACKSARADFGCARCFAGSPARVLRTDRTAARRQDRGRYRTRSWAAHARSSSLPSTRAVGRTPSSRYLSPEAHVAERLRLTLGLQLCELAPSRPSRATAVLK